MSAYDKVIYHRERDKRIANSRRHKLKNLYNLTTEQYEAMFEQQKGLCAICPLPLKGKGNIDHCHETGKVRGLLCKECNQGLGYFKDNVGVLQKAINYLNGN